MRQPALGATLEEVCAAGEAALAEGAVARRLVESSTENGGLLSLADLRSAAPAITPALSLRYRDVDVAVPAAPGGGITTLQSLAFWQALHPEAAAAHTGPAATRGMALALRLGVDVPGEFMIATVTDGPIAERSRPPITALRLDITAAANRLLHLLPLRLKDDRGARTPAAMPLDLTVRESTRRSA